MSVRRIKIRTNNKKTASAKIEASAWSSASRWPGPSRWIATGALMASAAVSTKPALAQQAGGGVGAASQAQTLAVTQFNIPAGPLAEVMAAFANATGSQVE